MDSFPLRTAARPFRLSAAAALLGVTTKGEGDPELRCVAPLKDAEETDLSILAHRRYLPSVAESRAGALLLSQEMAELLPEAAARPAIVVEDVHRALARLLEWMHPERPSEPSVHPTAVLGPGVSLGEGVHIGPYAVIEEDSELGDGVRIGAHTVVGAGTSVGAGSILHPHVVVYPRCILGRNVILNAGARIGADGFGYVFEDGQHTRVPHIGRCHLEDGVEIGANTTIDRGSIGDTWVGAGTKVDNLVQLGHNVRIGPGSIIVSQVGISGSAELGAGVMVGGQAGLAGHIQVGDGAQIAGQSGVFGDVPAGAVYMGFPARPRNEFLRTAAAQRKVPDLIRRLKAIESEGATEPSRPEDGDGEGGGA